MPSNPFTGIGWNVSQAAPVSGYATNAKCGRGKFIRYDTSGLSASTAASGIKAYKSLGFNTLALVSQNETAAVVIGFIRDLMIEMLKASSTLDGIELYNEPDYQGGVPYDATQSAKDTKRIKAEGLRYWPYQPFLLAGGMSSWDTTSGSNADYTTGHWFHDYWTELTKNAPGTNYIDGVAMHPYSPEHPIGTYVDPASIATWRSQILSTTGGQLPIVWTERAFVTAEVAYLKGSFSADNAAACHQTILQNIGYSNGVQGDGYVVYDGRYNSGQSDCSMLNSDGSASSNLTSLNTVLSGFAIAGVGG